MLHHDQLGASLSSSDVVTLPGARDLRELRIWCIILTQRRAPYRVTTLYLEQHAGPIESSATGPILSAESASLPLGARKPPAPRMANAASTGAAATENARYQG